MSRFWVGGAGTWDATTTTNWSATSGGAGGASVPTATDDVFFDGSSGGGTATIAALTGVTCKNFDSTGFTGTINGGINGITGTVVLGVAAGNGANVWKFTGSGAQTIKSNGRNFGNSLLLQGTGTVTLLDALTTSGNIQVDSGTFDTGSFNVNITGVFTSNNSNTRTLTLGSSTITCIGGGTFWDTRTTTGLTFNAGTSTISHSSSGGGTFSSGTLTFYAISLTGSVGYNIGGNTSNVITCTNFTRTGTAVKTDSLTLTAGLTSLTVTGALTLTGNSATNRLLVQTNAAGTGRSITLGGSATAKTNSSNVDFMDIIMSGGAANETDFSAVTGNAGDAGGNSGITFTPSATQTHTASAGGNWSDVTKWTSRVPLPQDDVVIDVNTTGTLTRDMPRLGRSINCTGFTGTLAASVAHSIYGSVTLTSGMSLTSSGNLTTVAGRSSYTIKTAGQQWTGGLGITAPGGTYTMQDNLATSTASITLNLGTFDCNGFSVNTASLSSNNSNTRGLSMNGSAWTVTGTATVWNMATATGLTWNSDVNSSIAVTNTTTGSLTFSLGTALTYNGTLTYNQAGQIGTLAISGSGSNTIDTLRVGAGRTLTFTGSGVRVIRVWDVQGRANGYEYLPGAVSNYVSAPDSAALSITGDIDIRIRCSMDDWTPAGFVSLVSKYKTNQQSYLLEVQSGSTGKFIFYKTSNGSTNVTATSTVGNGFTDGATGWVRVTYSSSTGDVKFYTSNDTTNDPAAVTWVQLGTTVTISATAIFDSNALFMIGSFDPGTSENLSGRVYRTTIYSGIGGTIAFDADFTTKRVGADTFTESSVNAATVTINGSNALVGDGRTVVKSASAGSAQLIQPTTTALPRIVSDYLSIQDITARSNAGGSGTGFWYAGATSTDVSGNTGWIFGTERAVSDTRSLATRSVAGARTVAGTRTLVRA